MLTWQEKAAARKAKREQNRMANTKALHAAGVHFHVIDSGWQLRIESSGERIDLMAGTGAWSATRNCGPTTKHQGVQTLIRYLSERNTNATRPETKSNTRGISAIS